MESQSRLMRMPEITISADTLEIYEVPGKTIQSFKTYHP